MFPNWNAFKVLAGFLLAVGLFLLIFGTEAKGIYQFITAVSVGFCFVGSGISFLVSLILSHDKN